MKVHRAQEFPADEGISKNSNLPPTDALPSEQFDLNYLKYVVAKVSNDSKIKVKLGTPGGGNFYNPEEPSITFDPVDLKKSERRARAIAAHEGRHRKETPTPSEMKAGGFDPEHYKELGFPSLSNVIEDMSINNSAVRDFPNLRGDYDELYSDFTQSEGVGALGHPETMQWQQQYGFTPRFSVALSELLKDWAIQREKRGYDEKLYITTRLQSSQKI